MERIKAIQELYRLKKYDAALLEIEELERAGALSSQLLVLRAQCIRLGSGDRASEVEGMLQTALEMDGESVEALLELGQYYLKNDQAEQASPLFQRAFEIANDQLSKAATGVARCLYEEWGADDALRYLERVREQVVDEMDLQAIQEEIEDLNVGSDEVL